MDHLPGNVSDRQYFSYAAFPTYCRGWGTPEWLT
jgi:hypothetical protein